MDTTSPVNSVKEIKEMKGQRKNAKKKRRIIMNNDGGEATQSCSTASVEEFLRCRTSPLLGSQVDTIFYCTSSGFGLFSHYNEVAEIFTTKKGIFSKNITNDLIEQGTDPLKIMVGFCREHAIEIFWSMRMNDTHDSYTDEMFSENHWKQEHPEFLMGKKEDNFPFGANQWAAVNYALPDVRERAFRIIQDVCMRYDVDGIEMDFFRHPHYFKNQMLGEEVTQENCDMLTDLIKRVRKMTEEVAIDKGHPILIATRVPDSVGYAKAIGIDLVRWLEEGLVDIVIGSGYFQLEPWENFVALGKPYEVQMYAGLSGSRLVSAKDPCDEGDIQIWRGEAYKAWKAGVDGIYTFNRFDPRDPIFRELGSIEVLEGLEKKLSSAPVVPKNKINNWLKDGKEFMKL